MPCPTELERSLLYASLIAVPPAQPVRPDRSAAPFAAAAPPCREKAFSCRRVQPGLNETSLMSGSQEVPT
jgi:hypothetical protein